MTKQDDQQHNLVQQHALDCLSKVEKEQRRAYKKEKQPLPWQQWIMMVILLVVLATMCYSLL